MNEGLSNGKEIGIIGSHHSLDFFLLELSDVVFTDRVLFGFGEAGILILADFIRF